MSSIEAIEYNNDGLFTQRNTIKNEAVVKISASPLENM